jgi:hypothetical protein
MKAAGLEYGDVGAAKAEFARQLDDVRRSAALERELDRAKVRNRSIVSKIIDMDRVTVGEDGADGVTLRFTMPDRADGWKQANPDDEVPQYRRGICRVNRWNDILRRKQKWLK